MSEPKDPAKRMIYAVSMIGFLVLLIGGPSGCVYIEQHDSEYDWAPLWKLVLGLGGPFLAGSCFDYGKRYGEIGGIMQIAVEALLPICVCFFLLSYSYDLFSEIFKIPQNLGKNEHWCHRCERILKIEGKDYWWSRERGSDGDTYYEVICENCDTDTWSLFDFASLGLLFGAGGLYASKKTYSHINKTWFKKVDR